MANKLWQKDAGVHDAVERFTIGNDQIFDLLLARHDVQASEAHATMLQSIGLLSADELAQIKEGLAHIAQMIEAGHFKIEAGVEDVHSQIEMILTERIGEAGKKIHSARSRNDQVLTALKLFLRAEIKEIAALTKDLFEALVAQSERYKEVLLPGYTHLQVAMPSSFGLWFGAYAESLCDDLEFLLAAYKVCNRNPLGSAAGYGSSFPLDREMTTRLLHFDGPNVNVVYAQMTRGKSEKAMASAMASLAHTLSKMAYDACLYMSQNFAFISLPEELTTGSSIMPHKKNPDVFELIRAKCNLIQGAPNQLTLLTNNLPSGYHRDMQLTKEALFPVIQQMKDCLEMAAFMMREIQVKTDILDDPRYEYLFSVDAVNALVLQGVSFRDAYRQIGMDIKNGAFKRPAEAEHTHLGSLGNLGNEQIAARFEALCAEICTTN